MNNRHSFRQCPHHHSKVCKFFLRHPYIQLLRLWTVQLKYGLWQSLNVARWISLLLQLPGAEGTGKPFMSQMLSLPNHYAAHTFRRIITGYDAPSFFTKCY